jgi:hypothetical protein
VSISNHKEDGCQSLPIDRESWSLVLEPALCNAPQIAEAFARLLFTIKVAIESGADGVKEAREMLMEGIEVTYLYTNVHKTSFKLYLLSLTGHLKPQDEPTQIISEAIKRGMAEVERASATERKNKKRG